MRSDPEPPQRLEDEVVLVTGGTRGIGRATTAAFAARGATVVAGYKSDEEAATATVDDLADLPGTVETTQFDVGDSEAATDAVDEVVDAHGCITSLVNNAGVLHNSLVIRMDPEEWEQTVETNLTGTFNCTKAAARAMFRGDGGSIVNVSSVAAWSCWPGQANYVASKAGINGFTRAVARELAAWDVRVNGVAPGLVDTESYGDLLDRDVDVGETESIPQDRLADPEEVAECIVFLASDRASYVTGEILRIDGGMLA